jgi:hypothetical protein
MSCFYLNSHCLCFCGGINLGFMEGMREMVLHKIQARAQFKTLISSNALTVTLSNDKARHSSWQVVLSERLPL